MPVVKIESSSGGEIPALLKAMYFFHRMLCCQENAKSKNILGLVLIQQ